MRSNRYMLVMFGTEARDEQGIDLEIEHLHEILTITFTEENVYRAHELANRYRITNKKKSILRELNRIQLRAFRFLINKN